jgi:hypothetical protein
MKKSLLKFSSILFIIFIYSINILFAQETTTEALSKEELKLQKLEEKVARTEEKIRLTEIKIAYADSLINKGFEMASEANSELKVISAEEKAFVKDNNVQRKVLLKQLKKADDEDVKSVEAELKKLELAYKTEIKSIDKRYNAEDKKLIKAKSNDTKGKEKLKQYNPKLKDYQKALEIADENLKIFKTENGY